MIAVSQLTQYTKENLGRLQSYPREYKFKLWQNIVKKFDFEVLLEGIIKNTRVFLNEWKTLVFHSEKNQFFFRPWFAKL